METVQQRDRNENNNSLLSRSDLDLFGGAELERPQGAPKIGDRVLEVIKGLSDTGLQLAGISMRGAVVGDLVDGHVGDRKSVV